MIFYRSFNIIDRASYPSSQSSIIPRQVFERLGDGGFLTNNRKLFVRCHWSHFLQFQRYICSMKKLEILTLSCGIKLEQLLPLFWSCPKLVRLNFKLIASEKLELDEQQKNELVQGFQRLEKLWLKSHIDNDSLPVIREILT
jgi:hypothetical protein